MGDIYCEHFDDESRLDSAVVAQDRLLDSEGTIEITIENYRPSNARGSDNVEEYIRNQENESVELQVCVCPYCQELGEGRSYFIVDENIEHEEGLDFFRLRKSGEREYTRDKSDRSPPDGMYAVSLPQF